VRGLRRTVHGDPVRGDLLLGALLERLEADCGMGEPYTLTAAEKLATAQALTRCLFAELQISRPIRHPMPSIRASQPCSIILRSCLLDGRERTLLEASALVAF
jgi:hypothetical protein